MLRPTHLILLLALLGAAGSARAEHRHDGCSDTCRDRGCTYERARGRDDHRDWDRHDRGRHRDWDRDHDRDRGRGWDRERDDRDRRAMDRYDRDRCERRGGDWRRSRNLSLVRFVVRVIDSRPHRDYECGCRHAWRSGRYDVASRHGDRHWIPGRYEPVRSCRGHA